jgi:hypothetical protein
MGRLALWYGAACFRLRNTSMQSTQQHKVKHHYIPQHYLKGFTDSPDSPYIWVYEKGSRQPFRAPAKAIAFENHFYTFTADDGTRDSNAIENFLADEIESPAAPILIKVRDRQMISETEKETLARYLVVLLKRVPMQRQRLEQQIVPKVLASLMEQTYQAIDTAITEHPEHAERLEVRKAEAQRVFEKYEREIPDSVVMGLLRRESVRVMNTLQAMTWRFLTFDDGQTFLTSDNPFFYFESIGIGKEYSEVTVPISKHIALWATWRQDLKEGFFPTNLRAVKEINRRTASRAARYVYYSARAKWVATLVNKPRQQLTKMF